MNNTEENTRAIPENWKQFANWEPSTEGRSLFLQALPGRRQWADAIDLSGAILDNLGASSSRPVGWVEFSRAAKDDDLETLREWRDRDVLAITGISAEWASRNGAPEAFYGIIDHRMSHELTTILSGDADPWAFCHALGVKYGLSALRRIVEFYDVLSLPLPERIADQPTLQELLDQFAIADDRAKEIILKGKDGNPRDLSAKLNPDECEAILEAINGILKAMNQSDAPPNDNVIKRKNKTKENTMPELYLVEWSPRQCRFHIARPDDVASSNARKIISGQSVDWFPVGISESYDGARDLIRLLEKNFPEEFNTAQTWPEAFDGMRLG